MTSFGTGPLLAVDAPALLYRSFFGVPKSVKNNALLGTTNTLLAVSASYSARAVVICFGNESAEYRVKAYPPYHANRPPMPPELEAQFDLATDFFRAFGWMVEHHDSLEADDLVHSFAQIEAEAGGEALILTGDRDLYQSVNARVNVLMMQKGGVPPARVDERGVYDRYGVRPDQVPDFIALRGDPSDRIPGARGIGPKTAAGLLRQHGTLDKILASGRFAEQAEDLRLYRRIATMDASAPIPKLPDQTPSWAKAAALARDWELNRLADRLAALAASQGGG